MAAGLAHELNNPATAARKAAQCLRENVEEVQDFACELNQTLSAEQWQQVVAAAKEATHCNATQPKLNPLEQSDREEAVETWLNAQNVDDAWELAPVLVNARIDEEELETLKRIVPAAGPPKCPPLADGDYHYARPAQIDHTLDRAHLRAG